MYGLKEIVAMNQEPKDLGMQILTEVLTVEVVEDCPMCEGKGRFILPYGDFNGISFDRKITIVPCTHCLGSGIKLQSTD